MKAEDKSLSGHFRIASELAGNKISAIDIGCKTFPIAPISLDIDFAVHPTIVGSVLELPLKSEYFGRVFLLEVIEHLPPNSELIALKEVKRILKPDGILILTTPYHSLIHTFADIAYWLKGHRHYKKNEIVRLVEKAGFLVEHISVRGSYWALLSAFFYYFIKKPFGFNHPKWLLKKADMEYNNTTPNGAQIFVRGRCVK